MNYRWLEDTAESVNLCHLYFCRLKVIFMNVHPTGLFDELVTWMIYNLFLHYTWSKMNLFIFKFWYFASLIVGISQEVSHFKHGVHLGLSVCCYLVLHGALSSCTSWLLSDPCYVIFDAVQLLTGIFACVGCSFMFFYSMDSKLHWNVCLETSSTDSDFLVIFPVVKPCLFSKK